MVVVAVAPTPPAAAAEAEQHALTLLLAPAVGHRSGLIETSLPAACRCVQWDWGGGGG
jgi:hypothetical protein